MLIYLTTAIKNGLTWQPLNLLQLWAIIHLKPHNRLESECEMVLPAPLFNSTYNPFLFTLYFTLNSNSPNSKFTPPSKYLTIQSKHSVRNTQVNLQTKEKELLDTRRMIHHRQQPAKATCQDTHCYHYLPMSNNQLLLSVLRPSNSSFWFLLLLFSLPWSNCQTLTVGNLEKKHLGMVVIFS